MLAEDAARAVAAFGLRDADAAALTTPLSDDEWIRFRDIVQQHRLFGLLADAVRLGAFAVTDIQEDYVAHRDRAWQRHVLKAEALLLQCCDVLDSQGLPYRVLKGSALAHTVYSEPCLRVYGDVDILVQGADLTRVKTALAHHLDAEALLPELRPGFDREFAKDVPMRTASGYEIDLHRTLAPGPFGLRIPVDELFEESSTFTIGGRELRALPPTITFLQVCYNAALGDVPPRLLSLRDVAEAHRTIAQRPAAVVARARRWGGRIVVARAVTEAWDTLRLAPSGLDAWAAEYRPSAVERFMMASSVASHRSYTRQVASVAAIRGFRAKGRYLRAIAAPSAEYLSARGWSRASHVRRAAHRLRPKL